MSGISGKTLTIFHNFEISFELLKSNVYDNHTSFTAIYAIMDNLRSYNNIIYRSLKKHRYDRVIELVKRAVNAYCTHFDTPGCEDLNTDNTLRHIDDAIALMQSIRERKG